MKMKTTKQALRDLILEQDEINENIIKTNAAIHELDFEQANLARTQVKYMIGYRDTLKRRITALQFKAEV